MDFHFSDEQRAFKDALVRFIERGYGFEQRRAAERRPEPLDRQVWSQLAELGVAALNVPEDDGGLAGGPHGSPIETLLAQEALGPGLVLEPVLSSAVIATRVVSAAAQGPQRAVLGEMAAGERIVVLAHGEPGGGDDPATPATLATAAGGGVVLDGHKAVVLHAPCADAFVVSATEAGRTSLWLVPAATPGVTLRPYRNLDGQPAGDVILKGVTLSAEARLGAAGQDARTAVRLGLDAGLAALCAEAVGIMDAVVKATVEYLRTRQQFGQPIGRFQALQHRTADMLMHVEQARSMACLAAMRCTDPDATVRTQALSAAKVIVGQACRFVSQQSVQLHGGMGMTDELDVSHFFKRLTAIDLTLGSADVHLLRFARSRYGLRYGSH